MKHKRAYLYRCYPTPDQAKMLARTFGCARFVYNWGLALRRDAYQERKESLYYSHTSAALTRLKQHPETAWLNEVSCVPTQQALRHLDKAYRAFFEGQGKYPKFKKKHGRQSAEYTASAFTWNGAYLTLAKMDTPLSISWSRPLPAGCKPTTVTISRDPADRYFVSFRVEEDIAPLPPETNAIGVDLGITDVVALSTGEKVGNPRFLAKDEKKLAKAQRIEARRKPGSKNRAKARRKVNHIHAHIADKRGNFLHQLTTRLIRENQTICVESLAVKNLLKNHTRALAISDGGWGELVRQLEYKAAWYGRTVIAIDRFFPSSKLCSICGHQMRFLPLKIRQWTCPKCGAVHDRDVNAAQTIRAEGLSVLACGAAVSPGRAGLVQARSREAGTPTCEGGNLTPFTG